MRQKQPATQPQLYWNTPILLTTRLECTSAHAQTVGMAAKVRRENLASNSQQTNKGSNI